MSHALSQQLKMSIELDLMDHFGPRPYDFASTQLLEKLYSKYISNVASTADEVALSKFLRANEKCMNFELKPSSLFDEYVIGQVKLALSRLSVPDDIFERVSFGPGSCHGSRNKNLASKLDGPWTTTSRWVYGQFIRAFRDSPHVIALANERESRYTIVSGSKLCFVPKKDSESRLICCEPLLNMALQKSVESYLTGYLYMLGCDLSTAQFRNRQLARQGSLDGSYATIDLSSASDSVSINLLREILPQDVFWLLMAIRSHEIKLPDGSWVTPHMISSMGNATTFPLETLVFWTICDAVRSLTGCGAFSVFGDDIVIPTNACHLVHRALNLFGFTVNKDKSFDVGHFRESCGGDYVSGRNVRPVYVTSLASTADIYSVLNRLVLWSARHGICLDRSVSLLLSKVANPLPIPLDEDASSGCYSYNRRGVGAYKALTVVPFEDYDEYSSHARSMAGLWGSLRGDKLLSRPHGRLRFRYVARYCPNWDRIPRGNILFEDVDPKQLSYWLDSYNLVAC